MIKSIYEILTWLPGIIFILSYILQIYKIHKTDNPGEIDKFTFILFFLGNIGAYLFTDKYFSLKTLSAYVIPNIFMIIVIGYSEYKKKEIKKSITYSSILTIIFICFVLFILNFKNNPQIKTNINSINNYAGYISLLFPIAGLLQLIKIIKDKHANGVSPKLWAGLGLGNIGCYILTGKYNSFQSIGSFLLSASLYFIIASYTLYLNNKNKFNKIKKI
jgi:uncharacterized protein with PQ loop repeat